MRDELRFLARGPFRCGCHGSWVVYRDGLWRCPVTLEIVVSCDRRDLLPAERDAA